MDFSPRRILGPRGAGCARWPQTAAAGSVVLFVLAHAALEGQELAPRTDPGVRSQEVCPPRQLPIADEDEETVTPVRTREAERLMGEANEAAILGDHERARALLTDAQGLDPLSGEIVYRLARSLDELGRLQEARTKYCRYLVLDPDPADQEEVRDRVAVLGRALELGPSSRALEAFQEGVEHLDRERFVEAEQAFSRALREHSEWPAAHYNRALARVGLGAGGDAVRDLERYLDLAPEASDRSTVRDRIQQLAAVPVRRHSPPAALMAGLLVPGMGQFYTGHTGRGLVVLTLAAGSVATGVLIREVEVRCLALPTNGECPAHQILERREDRPFLVPGLATAGVVTLIGAIQAYRSAGAGARTRGEAGGGRAMPGFEVPLRDHRLRFDPIVGVRGRGAGLQVAIPLRRGSRKP